MLFTLTVMTQPPEQNLEAVDGGVFKMLQILQENTCVGVSFLQSCKFQAAALLKRDSCTGNFMSNLRNSSECLF